MGTLSSAVSVAERENQLEAVGSLMAYKALKFFESKAWRFRCGQITDNDNHPIGDLRRLKSRMSSLLTGLWSVSCRSEQFRRALALTIASSYREFGDGFDFNIKKENICEASIN
jgi:hypothetical protein